MKSIPIILLLLLFPAFLFSQNMRQYNNCKNNPCRILESYKLSKYYLEADDITLAQKWLNETKKFHPSSKNDAIACSVHNLQSELFYYMGLFQFGAEEADKGIEKSRQIKDSMLIAEGYFFLGINQFELHKYDLAQKNLHKSFRFYPKTPQKQTTSTSIEKEFIYNNLAQVKLKIKQPDSALIYNKLAYALSKTNNSKRGIPNTEQTFGEIFLLKKMLDSSRIYFEKSTESALKSGYHDIVLTNYGFLATTSIGNLQNTIHYYKKGTDLIQQKKINAFFKRFFYETTLQSFKENNATTKINEVQEKIIQIDNEGRLNANTYIQNISEQYVNNSKKLLAAEIGKYQRQRNITILLIISASLCLVVMALAIMIVRRKTKEQNRQKIIRLGSLLEGQENERKRIAEELHDGIIGDLSAIKLQISALDKNENSFPDQSSFKKINEMIDQSCSQVRQISHDLMPAAIEEFGLIESIKLLCKKLNFAHDSEFDFQVFGEYKPLSPLQETTIYRIIQELLNNTVKHAQAKHILIQLNLHKEEISISVEDDGNGFDVNASHAGIGLRNLQSRIKSLQAEFDIKSSNIGTSVHILINLKKNKND